MQDEESSLLSPERKIESPSIREVFKKIWDCAFLVFFVFFVTLSLFPGVTSLIKGSSNKISNSWFQLILVVRLLFFVSLLLFGLLFYCLFYDCFFNILWYFFFFCSDVIYDWRPNRKNASKLDHLSLTKIFVDRYSFSSRLFPTLYPLY